MGIVETNFESALTLLDWARSDVTSLHRSVKRYFAGEPYEHFDELNPDTGNFAHKLRFTKRIPLTWRKLTFRVICDLRHCIDQAMFAAVHTADGEPPAHDIYFPWARDPTDLTHRRKKIPHALWPTLDRLEPYPRGDEYPGGDDTVYAIRDAAGPNKHRLAIKPQARPTGFSFKGTAEGDWRIPYDGWDGQKSEFTIIDDLPLGGERDYTVQFHLDIGFGEVEALSGKPVIPVLDHFGGYAAFVIGELMEDSAKIAGL